MRTPLPPTANNCHHRHRSKVLKVRRFQRSNFTSFHIISSIEPTANPIKLFLFHTQPSSTSRLVIAPTRNKFNPTMSDEKESTDRSIKEVKEELGKAAEMLQQFAKPVINATLTAVPYVIEGVQWAYEQYKKLPNVAVRLIIGFIMCFFGGIYPTIFAAIKAAEYGGLSTVKKALGDLSEEVMVIVEANKKDNEVDADGDGKADVDEIDPRELVRRKVDLVLRKVNPVKVNDALSSIYKVWLSVLAVLTIEFARVIALALTIGEFLHKFMIRWLAPILDKALPKEYRKWTPVVLDWICDAIGISVAWKVQTIISAFSSACAGGLIISRAILELIAKGKDHNDTLADEVASYGIAATGFYFQYYVGYHPPFPLNWFLWPLDIAESYIRWAITRRGGEVNM